MPTFCNAIELNVNLLKFVTHTYGLISRNVFGLLADKCCHVVKLQVDFQWIVYVDAKDLAARGGSDDDILFSETKY
jgi:hypothetical protein